jgi:flagellar protein FlaG
MVGNSTSVTAAQARTSAPSTAATAAADAVRPALAERGKDVAQAGQDLPVEREAPPPPDITAAVRRLNQLMAERQRDLSFHVDDASGRTVITVLDATTSEVVRQIPSEEVLALARALELERGLLDAHA